MTTPAERTTRQLVLVLGAAGQLGQAMVERLRQWHEVIAHTRADLDITSPAALREAIAALCPDVIINCAAYNKVDAAETDPLPAMSVNAWAVRSVARAASEIDATFVHYSTDFVFDGATDRPYVETDAPNPRGTYAASKLLGEWFAAGAPRHYVLRVASLFGGSMTSSIDHLLHSIREGRPVRAFTDRTVSPSFVEDVVNATRRLVEGGHPYGLYHCVNTGWTTWHAIAHELARLSETPDAAIEGVEMAASGLVARRPQFAALSNAKLTSLGIAMPTWQDAVERYVRVTTPGASAGPVESPDRSERPAPAAATSAAATRGPVDMRTAGGWPSARPKKPRGPGRAKKAPPSGA